MEKLIDLNQMPIGVITLNVLVAVGDNGCAFHYEAIDFTSPQPWLLWPPSVGLPAPELPEWGVWDFKAANATSKDGNPKISIVAMPETPIRLNIYLGDQDIPFAYRLKELAKGWTDDPSKVTE
jgi:hypothetical protein